MTAQLGATWAPTFRIDYGRDVEPEIGALADRIDANERFAAIRKGLLEFLILKIVAANMVYAADILKRLSTTEFATQEGTLYPLLSKLRREDLVSGAVLIEPTLLRPFYRRAEEYQLLVTFGLTVIVGAAQNAMMNPR